MLLVNTKYFATVALVVLFCAYPACTATDASSGTNANEDVTFYAMCSARSCNAFSSNDEISVTPTWHVNDLGIDLAGAPMTISISHTNSKEETGDGDGGDGSDYLFTCYKLETMAMVGRNAELFLNFDLSNDGTNELVHPIIQEGWDTQVVYVSPKILNLDLKFELEKAGQGAAMLYYWEIQSMWDCQERNPLIID